MSSILPNTICTGRRGISSIAYLFRGDGSRGGRGVNCSHDLRRESETNVLRHNLDFLDTVKALLRGEILNHFFHQALRSRGSSGERDCLYFFEPLGTNRAKVLNQNRRSLKPSCNFYQSVRIRAVLGADNEQ